MALYKFIPQEIAPSFRQAVALVEAKVQDRIDELFHEGHISQARWANLLAQPVSLVPALKPVIAEELKAYGYALEDNPWLEDNLWIQVYVREDRPMFSPLVVRINVLDDHHRASDSLV